MAYNTEQCVGCGTRARKGTVKVPDTGFWFCSWQCEQKTLNKDIERRYQSDRNANDDPDEKAAWKDIMDLKVGAEWSNEQIEKYLRESSEWAWWERTKYNFHDIQETSMRAAKSKLALHLYAEWLHFEEQREAKLQTEREKEEERLRKQEEKEEERLSKMEDKEYDEWREKEDRRMEEEARKEMLREKPIPQHLRFEHTHVLGPSGSGKTTLLQNNILSDFLVADNKINPDPPAYIIIDPKGLMVERLSKLQLFAKDYSDRIVIVDPFDIPALNLFTTHGRDPSQLVSDFSYIFSTTKQKLTGKQAGCFQFCARLLFALPHANLETFLDLLDDGMNKRPRNPVFAAVLQKLPPIPKRFFENDFYSANYASTREEIKSRIYGVAGNEHLAAMFNANTRTLDLVKCIRERKIVLVNTRMTQLKEAHQTLGRYIIALAQDAIQSRAERHPVFIVIDEFQEFADPEKTPHLLRLIREYGGGAVIAHQNMYCAELDDDTRQAISTNTSIKYASSPEGQDLNLMARDLRCEPEFLKQQHRSKTHARFACFVRNMYPPLTHPFIVKTELGWIDKWPKMRDEAYQNLRMMKASLLEDTRPETREAAPAIAVTASRVRNVLPAEADRPIVAPSKKDPSVPSKW